MRRCIYTCEQTHGGKEGYISRVHGHWKVCNFAQTEAKHSQILTASFAIEMDSYCKNACFSHEYSSKTLKGNGSCETLTIPTISKENSGVPLATPM